MAQVAPIDLGHTVEQTKRHHKPPIDAVDESSLLLVRVDRIMVDIEAGGCISIATIFAGAAGFLVCFGLHVGNLLCMSRPHLLLKSWMSR